MNNKRIITIHLNPPFLSPAGFVALPVGFAHTDGRPELPEEDSNTVGTAHTEIVELDVRRIEHSVGSHKAHHRSGRAGRKVE